MTSETVMIDRWMTIRVNPENKRMRFQISDPLVIFEYLNKISTVVSLHECASKSISHMETPGGFG